ncbi:hypothetical protein CcaCcLH18_12804 [Colletotrichum camelliae]|nr:hypothetical protein CcaCcLH18_12804 [Colletotrichum camelliae]
MASHPKHELYLFSPELEARTSSQISIALAESTQEAAANFVWTVHHTLCNPSKVPLAGTVVDRLVDFIRTAWAILQLQPPDSRLSSLAQTLHLIHPADESLALRQNGLTSPVSGFVHETKSPRRWTANTIEPIFFEKFVWTPVAVMGVMIASAVRRDLLTFQRLFPQC